MRLLLNLKFIMSKKKYVTIKEYSEHYGISRQSVYNMISRGDLVRVFDRLIDVNIKPTTRKYERN